MKNYSYLVNPVDVFREEDPEAFELLPFGAADLMPEINLMIAQAKTSGLPFVSSDDPNLCRVPLGICHDVFSKSWSTENLQAAVASLTDDVYIEGEVTLT